MVKMMFYSLAPRKYVYLLCDIVIIFSSYFFSYIVRIWPSLSKDRGIVSIENICVLIFVYIISFYFHQAYRILWTYSNISDMYKMISANVVGMFLYIGSIIVFRLEYSRLVLFLSFFIIAGATLIYRIIIRDYYSRKRSSFAVYNMGRDVPDRNKRVIIVGAGEAGRLLLSEYQKQGILGNVVCFLDDSVKKIGNTFNGRPVYGPIDRSLEIIEDLRADEVVVALPGAGEKRVGGIVDSIRSKYPSLSIRTLPSIAELIDQSPLLSELKEVGIGDLIDRDDYTIDIQSIENTFMGKTVLITGAGGSIGSELCRQIIRFKPAVLICIGHGENSIYHLSKRLEELTVSGTKIIYRIVDVKDRVLLREIFLAYKPDVVFHAAAHKHVPLMEYNEAEAIQNNVGGSLNLLNVSVESGVSKFILISTDKAVNPANVMGATKRITEILLKKYNEEKGLSASVVRFGNVLGSRGSVIPLFSEQIRKGGPVTVTHPDIMRFFMSIPEASVLVINAASFSKGGEIYVLDMGRMYRIDEIARKLIRFYGLTPEKDIRIVYTGLRPGEKLFEELSYRNEDFLPTPHGKIKVLQCADSVANDKIDWFVKEILPFVSTMSSEKIREAIQEIVPQFQGKLGKMSDGAERIVT